MGVNSQQPQSKATPTTPPVTGGKNQQPQAGTNTQMGTTLSGSNAGQGQRIGTFSLPQMSQMSQTPQNQGAAGMAQGYQGASGTMVNPNMGGIRGFNDATINTLSGGNVSGGGQQQGASTGTTGTPTFPRFNEHLGQLP